MEATVNFEVAVYVSWTVGIGLFLWFIRSRPEFWAASQTIALEKPGRETGFALIAVLALIAVSVITDSFFKTWKRDPDYGRWVFLAQLILVYTPVLAALWLRKHDLRTCYLSAEKLPAKIAIGLGVSLVASFLFLWIRGNPGGYGDFLMRLGKGGPVAMLQTFLEGFGIGFLLYRFAAWLGIRWSCVIVAVLFMAAHIPNYTSGTYEFSLPLALMFALAHAGIAVVVLYGIWKSGDIVVVGFLHWFINRATDFTSVVS